MESGLRDCWVLITGASGGIGQATARAFAAEGASLILHYHRQRDAAESLAEELPTPCLCVAADLRDENAVDAMFERVEVAVPSVDVLVANAGIWAEQARPLHRMSLAQWRGTLDGNLTSVFLSCRGFLRHLATEPREEAAIVLVGSTAGIFGEAGHADYACSKAALTSGLLPSLKNEIVGLAPRGRVNLVAPGWVGTSMAEQALEEPGLEQRICATIAMRKIAAPEDVARAIVFLGSPRLAGHLSGVVLPVHGGMEGRLLHPSI